MPAAESGRKGRSLWPPTRRRGSPTCWPICEERSIWVSSPYREAPHPQFQYHGNAVSVLCLNLLRAVIAKRQSTGKKYYDNAQIGQDGRATWVEWCWEELR